MSTSTVQCNVPPSFVSESNALCVRAEVLNESNAVQLFISFTFALNVMGDWFVS